MFFVYLQELSFIIVYSVYLWKYIYIYIRFICNNFILARSFAFNLFIYLLY